MKMKTVFYSIICTLLLAGCHKLDLNPLSDPSSGNFYSNETELTLAVNNLYQIDFNGNDKEEYSDNLWNRGNGGNIITLGTLASDNTDVLAYWRNCYRAIARANVILESLKKLDQNTASTYIKKIESQARFARAWQYGKLVTHFGDVPFLVSNISLEQAYSYKRNSKEEIISFVFDELDAAAEYLPISYTTSAEQRWTKGAALATKARVALYTKNFQVARDAAKAVIDQNQYALHSAFKDLFLTAGKQSREIIWSVPRSEAAGVIIASGQVTSFISRNSGGFASVLPTWSLMDAFECVDGLPIDKSPLYNPRNPFANRDPRLAETVVPFGTNWLGYSYQPHPDSLNVMNYNTNKIVKNNDTRANAPFASYTGLLWKKGIDATWPVRKLSDNDQIIIRYAEVLLTYAEAKVELGEIDQSVLDAINRVRARAYGKTVSQITEYPAVQTVDKTALLSLIKRERRVEFANEGLRYMDLIRWRLAEKALTRPVVGLPDPVNQDRSKWPFAGAPIIDVDGIPDYSALSAYTKQLAVTSFDKSRQYLWPIPAVELRVNPTLTQNPNY
jgi:hypothetical protein